MTDRKPKRPRDTNQLAKRIVDIATGDAADEDCVDTPESVHKRSVDSGRVGGERRAQRLTPTQRREIALKAAAARWGQGDSRDSDT